MKTNRNYGWLTDIPDQRDILFRKLNKIPKKLPESVDLRLYCSRVEDQGNIGSCTSTAAVGTLEYLENKDKKTFVDLSRLFVYYNTRVIQHTVNQDSGASLRNTIKTLAKQGCCEEKLWPYNISKFTNKPTNRCYQDGIKRKTTSYQRIDTIDEMKTCLADGFPFVFGFSAYKSFESQEVANTGVLPMPTLNEKLLGGHAVMAIGYNTVKHIFKKSIGSGLVRNSWGGNWGEKGYFWIPLEYLANRNLSDDFWTIRKII